MTSLMRFGAAISVVVHLGFVVVALILGEANLFHATTAEAITVDIVSSKDAPPPVDYNLPVLSEKPTDNSTTPDSKPAESKAETKSSERKPAETKPPESKLPESKPPEKKPLQTATQTPQQMQQPRPAAATPPPAPQQAAAPPPQATDEVPPQASPIPYTDLTQQYAKLVGNGEGDFDAAADKAANISLDSAKALRERLRECSILPKSVSPSDNVKIVLRVALLRNGKLARDPLLIQASASEKGPALLKSATTALLACQPFDALPADKYDEWKLLDLSFTPKDFKSG